MSSFFLELSLVMLLTFVLAYFANKIKGRCKVKKLKFLLVLVFFAAMFETIVAQNTAQVLLADSISNSQTEYAILNLKKYAPFDSVGISIYVKGEIDLDSLDVKGAAKLPNFDYQGSVVSGLQVYEAIEGATLTINEAAAAENYIQNAITVTKAEAKGYNELKVSIIAAASGNDATDTGQKYVITYTVYK